jgi:tetratricopeptide (TPR) repeat protein
MGKVTGLFILVLVFLVGSEGCNRHISPVSSKYKLTNSFDSSAFDYIFTEALKQKFLGNAGDALKYLEQCIRINPNSDAAYYEMAQIALMVGDRKNGKKFALKAASLDGKNFWYLNLVANIYYQQKVLDSAILYYEKILKIYPEKEDIKLNIANVYSENGQFEKAAEIYSDFEKKYGVTETTTLSIVKNLINAKNFKAAELKVKGLLEISPDEILYNGLLAEIYRENGEKEKAKAVYDKLLEKNPGNPQTLISLCDFMLTEKQYENIFPVLRNIVLSDSISKEYKVSLFSKIISDTTIVREYSNELELTLMVLEAWNNKDDIIILLRPELLVNENRIPEAILRLETIIGEHPDNYYAWERLLFLYSETKDWGKLFTRGEECATKFNRSFVAKILYANGALEEGKYSIASDELNKAKILAGEDTSKLVQVLIMEADVLYRNKDFSKSFDTFKEALKIKPDDPVILNNYAYYLAEQGLDLKEAERMAKIVIDNEKGNTTYLDTYAWVLYKRGRFREAKKIMDEIISKGEKEDAEWYEHLGYIMKALKDCDKAIEYWNLAYKIDKRKSALLIEIENCRKR